MLFITFIDDKIINYDNIYLFKKSINNNKNIIYLKIKDFDKNEKKINIFLEYLEKYTKKDEIICFINIFSTFFNNNLEDLESRFNQLNTKKIIFSSKLNEDNEVIDVDKLFEIDNCFIGYSNIIINFFKEICEEFNCRYNNTSLLIKEYQKFCKDCIYIDNNHDIFFNINDFNLYSIKVFKENIIYNNKIPIIITYHLNKNLINYFNKLLILMNKPIIKDYYKIKVYSDEKGKIIYNILKYTHLFVVLFLYFSIFFTNNLYYLIFLFCINLIVYIQWNVLGGCFWTKWENYYEKLFYIDYKFNDDDLESSNIKRMLKSALNIPIETSEYIMNKLPILVCFISLIKIYFYHIKNNKI